MERRTFAGLDIVVESPAGSRREWHDRAAGRSGSTEMRHDYGFLADHLGSDGEEVDCYLGPDESASFAYVVHQLAAPEFEAHDEDKVMLGFASEADAKAAYLAHRDDGDRAYGGMTAMPLERFKQKLQRRTGSGKIRHSRMDVVTMRVEQRGSKWVVLPETGDKVLGTHDTKAEAEAQLRAIEASKGRAAHSMFAVQRAADGRVAEHVWDFVCVEGWDRKDGQFTEFTPATLSQMVDNFAARGDEVPYDWNHQSGYTEQNGKPAPALAFAGALAVVWDGQVVRHGGARGVQYELPDPVNLAGGNGLYAYRCEVTDGSADYPLGQQILPGMKYLSPMFTSAGTDRQGVDVGYSLIAIGVTNTPWQPGTALMDRSAAGGAGSSTKGTNHMSRLARLAAYMSANFGTKFENDDEKDHEKALESKMEDAAGAAVMDEAFDYEGMAKHMEEMARLYEDAHLEPDGDEPAHASLRRMAARFRKMAGGNSAGPEPTLDPGDPAKAAPKAAPEPKAGEDHYEAKYASMSATLSATQAKLAKLEAKEAAREAAAEADKAQMFESLADAAIAGGYPKEARASLVKFARVDFEGARASVAHLLPKGTAPSHLFGRLTNAGAPIGHEADARKSVGPTAPRKVKALGVNFVAQDEGYADAIKRLAESQDPADRAKVDANLDPRERSVMFSRLLSAERIVKAENPELAEQADS